MSAQTAANATKKVAKPPGVSRIEILSRCISWTDRLIILSSIFVVAYVYSLDNTCRNAYQPYALSSFNEHSLQATVTVLGTVIGAVAQPITAKLSDIFGRVELIGLSVFFYVLGTVVQAVSKNVEAYSGGIVIWEIGHAGMMFILQIMIADFTSTRWRVLFSFIPQMPSLINTWVSGSVASSVLAHAGWRWGFGMWAIVIPVTVAPIFVSMYLVSRRAKRFGMYTESSSFGRTGGVRKFVTEIFWMLDVIGIILLVALLALTLVPLTLAGGQGKKWQQAHIIAPLVVGVLCIPLFVLWELRAPQPLVPFPLLKKRGVWAPTAIGIFLNFTFVLVAAYFFTVLRVSFDFSVAAATRITSLYGFANALVCPFLGFAVYRTRRLKLFVVFGTLLYMAAFGLLIRFRGSPSAAGRAGVIAAEVLLGVAGGTYPYAAQASMQVELQHKHLAAVTGVNLAVHYIGSALGAAVSGALWTQLLPARLELELASVANTKLTAAAAFADPLNKVVPVYPLGTPERTAVIGAYMYIQKILATTAICLCVPLVVLAFLLPNPKLTDAQTLAPEDEDAVSEEKLGGGEGEGVDRTEENTAAQGVGDQISSSTAAAPPTVQPKTEAS